LSSEHVGFGVTFERFTGFAGLYDDNRPRPPEVLGALLPRIARTQRPDLVVDLGCGTGLSTRFWADRAERVGDARRLVGLARSQGSVAALFKNGLSESEIGLEEPATVAERTLGNEPQPWHWSARVSLGVA
jgi:SAM-dependent methyltransferase